MISILFLLNNLQFVILILTTSNVRTKYNNTFLYDIKHNKGSQNLFLIMTLSIQIHQILAQEYFYDTVYQHHFYIYAHCENALNWFTVFFWCIYVFQYYM